MPIAYPLPEPKALLTAGRESLDIPGVKPIRTMCLNRTDIEETIRTQNHIQAWRASIQLNDNWILTWTGDRPGANLMGWAILMAAHALKAEYRLSPEEPGTIYFSSATAAAMAYDLALDAPWLNA